MRWYLLEDGHADGATNMARDDYLFGQAERWGRPLLRLYEWSLPTLSLGRNQKLKGLLDLAACAARGIVVVRRMTGGWAVLHGQDLTYTVVAPAAGPFGGSIMTTYEAIARAFEQLLGDLGFAPRLQPHTGAERVARASPICFAVPAAYELLVEGRKLVGSAQRRRAGAFMQHGSIPVRDQSGVLAGLFSQESTPGAEVRMTDLERLGIWPRLSVADFRQRLVAAFGTALQAEFEPLPWSGADDRAVADLRHRFTSPGQLGA